MTRLDDLASPDVAGRPVLVVPIGSCEQHGPHLPLGTDSIIAVALADRLAAVAPNVLVTPPIAITASGEHQGFPGTLSIGTDVLRSVLVELVRSADWARGVLFVNGHGGNVDAVRAATAQLTAEGHRVLSWWPPVGTAARQVGLIADAHAGAIETAIVLALRPDLVQVDRLAPGNLSPIEVLMPALRQGGVAAVSPGGVLGDPRPGTLEIGTQLLELFTTDLVAAHRRAAADWNCDTT